MSCTPSNVSLIINESASHDDLADNSSLENTDSFFSYQVVMSVTKTADCSSKHSLFLIGAPANLLTMIVFCRQGLRDRMNLCLFCLAFVDLMYLITLFVMASYCFIGIVFPDQEEIWKWFFIKYNIGFVYGFGISSGCVTMIIAVERCVCVMFPMKSSTVISTKTMAIILLVTLIVIQLLCSVYIIKDQITVVKNNITGKKEVITTTSDLYLSHNVFSIIENIVLSSISLVTFTVVCFSSILIVLTLRKAMTWRQNTTSCSSYMRGQTVLVRMLVAVCCLYMLCTAPNVALALTRFLIHEFHAGGVYGKLFLATHMTGNVIVMINSSVNFFVYVTMSSRFRHELKMYFCLLLTRPEAVKPQGLKRQCPVRTH